MRAVTQLLPCFCLLSQGFAAEQPSSGNPEVYEIRRAITHSNPEIVPPWNNPIPLPPLDFFKSDAVEFLRRLPFDDWPLPAVYKAVLADDEEWLDSLLARGLSPDQTTLAGDTPLCAAVRQGRLHLVRRLLLAGASTNAPGYGGQRPLPLASLRRPVALMEALLLAGADPDERFASPADPALLETVVIRDLKTHLEKDRGLTPLMACAARGDVEGAATLLAHGATTSAHTSRFKRYAINFAATQRFLFLMRVLLGRPADAEPDLLITVDLSRQRAWLTRSGAVIESASISTGRSGYETPPGRYVITDKHRSWISTLYKVPMPWFMRLNCGAIGLHSGHVTGRPASHGCIRLPAGKAKRFFQLASVGDEVEIVR